MRKKAKKAYAKTKARPAKARATTPAETLREMVQQIDQIRGALQATQRQTSERLRGHEDSLFRIAAVEKTVGALQRAAGEDLLRNAGHDLRRNEADARRALEALGQVYGLRAAADRALSKALEDVAGTLEGLAQECFKHARDLPRGKPTEG